jgi:hypothetical protein
VPYYVYHEAVSAGAQLDVEPRLRPVVADFLSTAEIDSICLRKESGTLYKQKDRLLNEGCLCFGLTYRDEIVAYMWCSFRECRSRLANFPLRNDEVYLFQAVTFDEYRGNNFAPFLRSRLYEHLRKLGRTNIFSITEALNHPAVRFKEKLRAERVMLGVYFCLFNRLKWNVTLRHYRERTKADVADPSSARPERKWGSRSAAEASPLHRTDSGPERKA